MATRSLCLMIRRWLCIALCAVCVAGMWWGNRLWKMLEGQSAFRISAVDDSLLADDLRDIAEQCDAQLGAFSIRDTQGLRLYECVVYHPEALGILSIDGDPLTSEQIAAEEPVAMLSKAAAMLLSPDLNCIGDMVQIDGAEYKVIAVYREYEPLGALTRTAEASAIIPARQDGEPRRFYIWIDAKPGDVFAYQQASDLLEDMNQSADAGSFQVEDITGSAQSGRQGIRVILLILLAMISTGLLRAMAKHRRDFARKAQNEMGQYYAPRAVLRLIVPFCWQILPSIAVCAAEAAYSAYCAAKINIGVGSLPGKLLNLSAWTELWTQSIIWGNAREEMPFFSALLNGWLETLTLIAGAVGIGSLWIGLQQLKKDK